MEPLLVPMYILVVNHPTHYIDGRTGGQPSYPHLRGPLIDQAVQKESSQAIQSKKGEVGAVETFASFRSLLYFVLFV